MVINLVLYYIRIENKGVKPKYFNVAQETHVTC